MKALKAFIKPFEAPQISAKINIDLKFFFQHNFQKYMGWAGLNLPGISFQRIVLLQQILMCLPTDSTKTSFRREM